MATETKAPRGAAGMARMMGLLCVADSKLGEFGEGQRPVTRTGDYSDVAVVDADGRIIPWQRVARLDGTEMVRTMREIVDRLYTFPGTWTRRGSRCSGLTGRTRPRNGTGRGKNPV